MLENVVNVIEKIAPGLQHVSLAEGTKWYGCHLGPIKTPGTLILFIKNPDKVFLFL